MTSAVRRIAMWSGPRNISTAMMRSWGNRADTFVCDEPLYAHYLLKTGVSHPAADAVIRSQDNDWHRVVAWLTEHIPLGKTIFYQKHMTHHLLPEMDRKWLDRLTNCFLIRNPREVITSYIKKNPHMGLADSGFPQLAEIFDYVRAHSETIPPVVDARDVLENPRRVLGLLCDALGVEFTDAMLAWPPGLRPTDGIWAKHWYTEVESSTSFQPYRPKPDPVPKHVSSIYEQCIPYYEQLYRQRLH
jgi:hypothetical protein